MTVSWWSSIAVMSLVMSGSSILAVSAQAAPFEETFEGFAVGDSVSAPTPDRNQGSLQGNWFVEDGIGGASLDLGIVGQGRGGGNALRIGGAVGTGVTGISSPSAIPPAGETGTTASFPAGPGSTVADTPRGASRMKYSFDFRTAADTVDSNDEFFIDFGVADLTSRLGWVRLSNVGGGFGAQVADFSTASGSLEVSNLDLDLGWGAWYSMVVDMDFHDGPDNDVITYSLLDDTDSLVNSVSIGSWEGFYGLSSSDLPAVHQMSVQVNDFSGFGYTGTAGQGVLIDNVSIRTVPIPATWMLFAVGLIAVFFPQIRKRLQDPAERIANVG